MTTPSEAPDLWCQPVAYAVRVQGAVSDTWIAEYAALKMTVDRDAEGVVTTSLVGTLRDQAQLIGLLTRLYDLSHPIISVQCLPAQKPA